MPSTIQSGDGESHEPSEYADDFNTDPAKVLAKNEDTAIAVIKGTNNIDLLDAYLQVELDREQRSDVVGAINARKQTVRTCPRDCDAPVMDRFETTDAFQIKHQNAVQHKTCVTLKETESGEEAMVVVFHEEPEPEEEPEPDQPEPESTDDEDPEEEAEEIEDDDGEADDEMADEPVGQRPKQLFHKMRGVDGTMNLAGIKGWCGNELGLSPDESKHVLDTLVNGGYVEEVDDGVFRCPPE